MYLYLYIHNKYTQYTHTHTVYIYIYIYIYIYTVPSKSIGTVKTQLFCWLWSQDICKYDEKMNMRQNYRISNVIMILLAVSTHTCFAK